MPRLSVLVNGVFDRLSSGPPSLLTLIAQAEGKDVEVLFFADNRKRTIGLKRTGLLQLAQGDYVSCVDDDDEVPSDYVDQLLIAMETKPDVIVFPMKASFDGKMEGIVEQSIFQKEQEVYVAGGVTRRRAAQLACWRRNLIQDIPFPDCYIGEDYVWGDQACARAKTEVRIDKVLYHYRWRTDEYRQMWEQADRARKH